MVMFCTVWRSHIAADLNYLVMCFVINLCIAEPASLKCYTCSKNDTQRQILYLWLVTTQGTPL